MSIVNREEHKTYACIYCNGIWVGGSELAVLLAEEEAAPGIEDIRGLGKSAQQISDNRNCPSCDNTALHIIKVYDVELDLCSRCDGIFFDEHELKKVLPNVVKPDSINVKDGIIVGEGLFWFLLGL
jgi:Zn-finger nucleic acid-binding protein